jgi:hypothetical protein
MNKKPVENEQKKPRGRPAKQKPESGSKYVEVNEIVVDDALLNAFFKKERQTVTWYLLAKAIAVAVTTVVFGFFGALGIGLAAQLFM